MSMSNGEDSTEMVEMKPVVSTVDRNGSASAPQAGPTTTPLAAPPTSTTVVEGNGTIRKDADTIVVNVITEKSKTTATSGGVSVREEQV